MEIEIIASGSAGNSAAILDGRTIILIDAGLGIRKLIAHLTIHKIHPADISAILVTHEHSDHVASLKSLCDRWNTPVFTTRLTANHLNESGIKADWNFFNPHEAFDIDGISVYPFEVPHDAIEPMGYLLSTQEKSIGFISDCGHVTKAMLNAVASAETLCIEANHDSAMLRNDTSRPWQTKRRIISTGGHLSNHAAALAVKALAGGPLKKVILCHLSSQCNTPEIATNTVRVHLQDVGGEKISVECAKCV